MHRAEARGTPLGAIRNQIVNMVCVWSFPLSQLLFPVFFSSPSYGTCSINTSLFLTRPDQPGFVVSTTPTFGAERQPYPNSYLRSQSLCLARGDTANRLAKSAWLPWEGQLLPRSRPQRGSTLPSCPTPFASVRSPFFSHPKHQLCKLLRQ